MESIYDIYEEHSDDKGYTDIAAISDYHRKYTDLKVSSLNENYLSVITNKKCQIKSWIALTTVTVIECALAAGLT